VGKAITEYRTPASDELLRHIFESAVDFAIFSMDPRGLVTSWNVGAERLLGYSEDEILGTSADIIFPEEDPGAGSVERRVALENGSAEDERWQKRKDGSRIWASGLLMRLAAPEEGFVKILRDRTAQHRSEELLHASEERFRLLATNIPQLVFLSRPDGRRTWPSPQWIEFTGLGTDQSLGLGWLEAIHPDDREATIQAWQAAVADGEYYAEHRVRWARHDQYRWHQTRARPIDGTSTDGSTEWVGTMTDIDDIRRLQGRQQVLLAELQHRTRNLLALVQAIARQTFKLAPSPEGFVASFNDRLQALSRVQALLGDGQQNRVDVKEILRSELLAHEAGADEPSKVVVDGPAVSLPPNSAQALGLAVHELVTNAVKYGALGRPEGNLSVLWQLVSAEEGRKLRLDWVETGVSVDLSRPMRRGYGSELIERALPYQLNAETTLEFGSDGLRCSITVPLADEKAGASSAETRSN
jgi:PAS domain S-box-containing protein